MIFQTPRLDPEEESALAKIEALRSQLRYYVATEPRRWLGSVRRVLAARAIQGSNSIEGYNVSDEDAVAAIEGDEPADATSENWLAVTSYQRAMTYVLQLAQDQHFAYSSQLLRSLHFMMTEYSIEASPGLWRPGPIWVRNDATGEVVYEAPPSAEVPGLIDELVDQLSSDHTAPAMVRAAMAHLNLAMIHPFRDGNGRMSRCLQTLVLTRDQILAADLCSIEEYLGRNTGAYYDILGKVGLGRWHPDNDARPWMRFCLQAHYVQALSVLRRIRESEQIWNACEELVSAHRLPARTVGGLFDAALGLRIRNSSYRTHLRLGAGVEISNQVATTDLREMVKSGLLLQQGYKRGTFYKAGEQLAGIRNRMLQARDPIDTSSLFQITA